MCKVCRVVDDYDIAAVEEDLAAQYESDELSLRAFADRVNAALIERVLADADDVLPGDPLSLYTALTDSSVEAERQAQTKDALVYAGVDVDALQDEFVSHMTVRKHLRECRGLETGQQAAQTVASGQDTIEYSLDYATRTIRQVLARLEERDEFTSGAFDVTVTARVTCTECNSTYRVAELLEHGGCDCHPEPAATPHD